MEDRARQWLAQFYHNCFGKEFHIIGIEPIRKGWECEIYFLTLKKGIGGDESPIAHVLRAYQGNGASERARHEYALLERLYRVGYPVPQVYALSCEESPLGKPFILMEKVEGISMWRPLFYGKDPVVQERLLSQFCRLMITLHTLEPEAFYDVLPRGRSPQVMEVATEGLAPVWGALGSLGFGPLLKWLEERAAHLKLWKPALVHNDFHPNNVLLRPDGSAVVIDWAHASLADPRFDVGWTLALIGSEVNLTWRDRVLENYQRLFRPVDELLFFEALGCIKRLGIFTLIMHGYGQEIGLLPDLASDLQGRLEPMRKLYAYHLRLTGMRIPSVEDLLGAK